MAREDRRRRAATDGTRHHGTQAQGAAVREVDVAVSHAHAVDRRLTCGDDGRAGSATILRARVNVAALHIRPVDPRRVDGELEWQIQTRGQRHDWASRKGHLRHGVRVVEEVKARRVDREARGADRGQHRGRASAARLAHFITP
jgi:hypothetical protein